MTVTPGDPVRLERRDGLAVVTLDNPPLNLFSGAVLDRLADAMSTLTAEPPRALLVRGAGDVMSGGVDVELFKTGTAQEFEAASRRYLEQIVLPLEALPCPTVAACHGLCLTAAFELALACDVILAATGATFGLVEAALGLTPAMGGTQRLAARAGVGRAAELVLTGRLYNAQTMHDWGVVSRVHPDGELAAKAETFAARLASGPTAAHAATKQVLAALRRGGVAEADAELPALAGALFDTADLHVGVASFLERGPGHAAFTGR